MKGLIVFSALLLLISSGLMAQPPLISHIYAADPSAHVWSDNPNKLWLYTSHDANGTNHHGTMFDYHVFSTEDLVNWTDHGRVLSVDDVDWAISHAWAIDAAYWKGNYYLVFCMRNKQNSDKFQLGMAVSSLPEGPFTSIGIIRDIEGMDPALFIDDDQQPYIIYAHARKCYIGKLHDDLLSVVPGTLTDVTAGLPQLQEGPWLHKYNNKYYLSYPGLRNDQWPEVMYYSIADRITGPYIPQSQYIPHFEGQAGSNHGSIVKFKENWIAFYHGAILSGGNGYNRNLMADFIIYHTDGTIRPVIPAREGITNGEPVVCNIRLEAESGKASGGMLVGTYPGNTTAGFSGNGYVTGFNHAEEYTEVLAQVAFEKKYMLEIRYTAESSRKIALCVNDFMLNGDYAAWKDIILPASEDFSVFRVGEITLNPGDNRIKLMSLNGDLKLDYFTLRPL
ncbi:MAG: family 43 glycosylhydrolase [Bacteroidales bacterium]|nr:family 43 glycosylhydrolase [Bacteroidales bacterium]